MYHTQRVYSMEIMFIFYIKVNVLYYLIFALMFLLAQISTLPGKCEQDLSCPCDYLHSFFLVIIKEQSKQRCSQ